MVVTMNQCRCGHSGDGPHPCHGNGYACKKPSSQRFIVTNASLSGVQTKFGTYQTWACDECWEDYKKINK